MNWNNLQVFAAIARAGTLSGAANALGVNHATVFRHLNAFEAELGVRLFDRARSGYALTAAGEEMWATVVPIETEIDRLDRLIAGRDISLSGTIAFTTTDTLAMRLLGRHIAAFKAAYPRIDLDLRLETQHLNLSKRQADVALRPTLDPPETLVGRRLATIAFAPYGATDYMAASGGRDDLQTYKWLVTDETLSHLAAAKWAKANIADADVVLRSNNLMGVFSGIASGMGVGLLPCFIGDSERDLQRIGTPIDAAASALWLLTHEDLRRSARIRAFMDFMAGSLAAERDLFEGRQQKAA